MVFIFDLDDTVCDTDGYSTNYINNFLEKHHLPFGKIKEISRFAEEKFSWDKDTALCWYKTYGDQMMAKFPCKPGAIEVINNLYDNGHTIIIATARATDWHTDPENITLNWLNECGIKYHKIYMGRVDKEQICASENADVFMDDDLKIAYNVANHPHNAKTKVFLMNTDYNLTQPTPTGVTRINSMNEMADIVLNYNNEQEIV